MGTVRRFGYWALFMMVGALMPFSILAAGAVALRHRRGTAWAGAGKACSIDGECPTGFVCLDGRCVSAG